MTLSANKEKVEEIIKTISITEIDYSEPIDECLINVEKLISLKSELELVKSDSRFLNNPSIISLNKEKKKLLVRKDFNERKWIDPQKILMAITPGFFLICLAAPPAVFGALTLLYLI
tara:strand:- start:248 stop:598 length:351 start_codon:yes stop_codon:yes gene_type:complete